MYIMKILSIIPARSGSKSLPDKNILDLNGKPVLAWSIEQAKQSKFASDMRIVVSTDSEKYANIARQYGAEAPFLRPSELSGDLSTDIEFLSHALEWFEKNEKYVPDIILQLRPTSPTRKVQDIDDCLTTFINNIETYDSLRSVIRVEKSPYKMYTTDESFSLLLPLFKEVNGIQEPYNQCRQILPSCFLHNGYIDIIKASIVKQGTISGERIYPYIMSNDDEIDIDHAGDMEKAKEAMSKS